jgi:cytochrome c-type biogenesis protein CcmH
MLMFWLLAAAMTVAGLALLLLPLLRPPSAAAGDRDVDAAISAQRARALALEQQRSDGSIDAEAYADAREEIERQVLRDGARAGTAVMRRRATPLLAMAVLVLFPLCSLGLYWHLGSRDALRMALDPMASLKQAVARAESPEQLDRLGDALRRGLQEHPDDLEGWRLLARVRVTTGRFARAEAALERALALSDEAIEDLVDYVEAASMANDMRFPALAQERIELALARAPRNPRALMLGALAAIQRDEPQRALTRLREVMELQPPDGDRAVFLRNLIARLEGDVHGAAGRNTTPTEPAASTPRIAVQVSVADSLATALQPSQRVFVFARAASGPPMPLAAVSLAVAQLPSEVVLDDGASMVPGRTLSSAAAVVVGARISASGSATPGSGDLEGFSEPLDPRSTSSVAVVIDRVRP